VAQQLNRDWPLCIEDNSYRQHWLLLKPGDMVFYEGGRLLHGRPEPLDGQAYANIFCHFKPVTYQAPAWRETLKTTATNGSPA
jgi:prolyl 4-hydroxylase